MTDSTKDLARSFIDDDVLASFQDYNDVVAYFKEAGIVVDQVSDYGSGFSVIDKEDKRKLIGVPLFLISWKLALSDKFRNEDGPLPFVIVHAMTSNGQKIIFTDGSTGIARQLQRITERRRAAGNVDTANLGLVVPRGLVASDYDYEDDKGNVSAATTYYLNETSAQLNL